LKKSKQRRRTTRPTGASATRPLTTAEKKDLEQREVLQKERVRELEHEHELEQTLGGGPPSPTGGAGPKCAWCGATVELEDLRKRARFCSQRCKALHSSYRRQSLPAKRKRGKLGSEKTDRPDISAGLSPSLIPVVNLLIADVRRVREPFNEAMQEYPFWSDSHLATVVNAQHLDSLSETFAAGVNAALVLRFPQLVQLLCLNGETEENAIRQALDLLRQIIQEHCRVGPVLEAVSSTVPAVLPPGVGGQNDDVKSFSRKFQQSLLSRLRKIVDEALVQMTLRPASQQNPAEPVVSPQGNPHRRRLARGRKVSTVKMLISRLKAEHPQSSARDICNLIDKSLERASSPTQQELMPLGTWMKMAPSNRTWVEFYDDKETHERVRGFVNNVRPFGRQP
jgi:hypothetical protein